jgi:dipeptidyl aminopeptidase/acylaminoacyl peptidase
MLDRLARLLRLAAAVPAVLAGSPAAVALPAAVPAQPPALALQAAAPAPAAPAQRLLTVDDQLALRAVADPHLSPEGRWVAYTVETADLAKDRTQTDVFMVPFVAAAPGATAARGGAAPGGPGAAAATPIRLTAGDKSAGSPRFSPDGRYLAFLSARDGCHSQVWLLDRQGGEAQRLTDFKADVKDLAWSPDSRRLALVAADPEPAAPAAAAAPAGRADGDEAHCQGSTPRPIVIRRLQFKRDGEGYLSDLHDHIHVFDRETRTSLQVTAGPYDDSEPAWSPDGAWLAFTSNRTPDPDANENTDIFVVPAAPGFTPRAITTAPSADQSPVWSPDGRWIAYVEGGDPKDFWYGTSHIAVAPALPAGAGAGTGGGPRPLTAALDRNVAAPRFSADGRAVLFLVEEGGNRHLARVPLQGGAVERLAGGERTIDAFDLDSHGDIVVLESEPDRPPELAALTGGSALRRLTSTNDELLRGLRLAPVERHQARSADGTPVDVFLIRPPDAPAGAQLPAVLRIHGGPTAQYDSSFRFEWQLLAAHGYLVIAANPRGSSGYGRDFAHALWADWGDKDFADEMAAVDLAVAMGGADPERLGVGGWSYGGILTDYVITKTGRFKAAIAGASETNFLANYGTDHYQYAWETELGLPWRNVERWMALSPWFQVDRITTPTLVLCGTDDVNVPALNSEQLYQALRRLGRDTELILYPGQTHHISRPSFVKDRYERYVAWYDRYLKPAPAAAASAP